MALLPVNSVRMPGDDAENTSPRGSIANALIVAFSSEGGAGAGWSTGNTPP